MNKIIPKSTLRIAAHIRDKLMARQSLNTSDVRRHLCVFDGTLGRIKTIKAKLALCDRFHFKHSARRSLRTCGHYCVICPTRSRR